MAPEQPSPEWSNLPKGSQQATANLADGRTVLVVSEPRMDGDIAPFGDEVQQVANGIADDL